MWEIPQIGNFFFTHLHLFPRGALKQGAALSLAWLNSIFTCVMTLWLCLQSHKHASFWNGHFSQQLSTISLENSTKSTQDNEPISLHIPCGCRMNSAANQLAAAQVRYFPSMGFVSSICLVPTFKSSISSECAITVFYGVIYLFMWYCCSYILQMSIYACLYKCRST